MEHHFETFCDLQTVENKISLITVYAGGNTAVFRSLPFFAAFKYYKLGPVSIKLVPASTLPVDPTGLSYGAGENTVDPRDQLTPGLVRITNGEDFNIKGAGSEIGHAVYNSMLLDHRWFKFSLQEGLSKSATPWYWHIGQFRQDYYPGSVTNLPTVRKDKLLDYWTTTANQKYAYSDYRGQGGEKIDPPEQAWDSIDPKGTADYNYFNHSSGRGIFQTGQHGELGWMPTDALVMVGMNDPKEKKEEYKLLSFKPAVNNVPQVELFRILLPPAYKTKYYYRLFVTETIYFKDPVVQLPEQYKSGTTEKLFVAPLDRFIRIAGITAAMPTDSVGPESPTKPHIKNEAGNAMDNITINEVD